MNAGKKRSSRSDIPLPPKPWTTLQYAEFNKALRARLGSSPEWQGSELAMAYASARELVRMSESPRGAVLALEAELSKATEGSERRAAFSTAYAACRSLATVTEMVERLGELLGHAVRQRETERKS